MKTVCYVHKDIANIGKGGLSTLFKTLAAGISKRDCEVHCITTQELTLPGIITHNIEVNKNPYQYSEKVEKIVRRINPDIAECSTWRFELLSLSRHKNDLKTKIVVRCDPSATTLFPNARDLEPGERELCGLADKLIAVSKFAANDIQNKYRVKNIKVIYNGISIPNTQNLTGTSIISGEIINANGDVLKKIRKESIESFLCGRINIFWVGKTTKMKGFDLLENIISLSPDDYFFVINLGHSLPEVVWQKSYSGKCIFLRNLEKNDQLNIWSRCNVFLSTSRVEGFGLTAIEALSLGLPLILNSECRVFHEFIPNPRIYLQDMSESKNVIKLIEKCVVLGKTYLPIPPKFTSETMVKATIKLYEGLTK